jgi:hypothetical protein
MRRSQILGVAIILVIFFAIEGLGSMAFEKPQPRVQQAEMHSPRS